MVWPSELEGVGGARQHLLMGNFDLVVSGSCHSEVWYSKQIQIELEAVPRPGVSFDLAEALTDLSVPKRCMTKMVDLAWDVYEYS